jgi:KUP system potassium uptake protein
VNQPKPVRGRYLLTLSLGALGVVYGDIGTSPLYALRECFHNQHGVPATQGNIMGILSLIVWSLIVVISIKYLGFVMRADNRGEGGILALMSLVRPRSEAPSIRRAVLIALGLFGAALLYGDGMITPAISVLSAIEGLQVATPVFTPYIVPITIVVIIGLFFVQKFGTAKVGAAFGPVMIVWFLVLAVMGLWHIRDEPHVLLAINPIHAVRFFVVNRGLGFLVLGSVFLSVTGGEALYADMGHFGAKPIRLVWFIMVFPSLLLNYFGQGAYLLHSNHGADDPFFHMAPKWAVLPLVVLATLATVIASQAVISGAFSLTRQAVQLGYLPRILVRHTSAREIGQIYIPSVNWILMLSAIGLVLAFRASSALAAAYGVAVTATMGITTLLLADVARKQWNWPRGAILGFAVPFLIIDLAFFGANIVKVLDGGWFPLAVGILVYTIMTTWRTGRRILADRLRETTISEVDLLRDLEKGSIPRVPGTAVFMSRYPSGLPATLLHNIKHNKVVHKSVILMSIESQETARLEDHERITWQELGSGLWRLVIRFGFIEEPNIPALLERLAPTAPVNLNPMSISYFLGREMLIVTKTPGMATWREHMFASMMRNASSASQFFCLPPNQVIEIGAQVEI